MSKENDHDHSHDHNDHHDHNHGAEMHDFDNEDFDSEDEVIVLEDEDGTKHSFILGEVLTVESKDYAVLLPVDEDVEEGVIFRIEGEDGDQMVLADIEDDAEWEKVVTAYNEQADEDDDEAEED